MGMYSLWHRNLRAWLREKDVTELEFARLLKLAAGDSRTLVGRYYHAPDRPPVERVHAWVHESARPSHAYRALVEVVTSGAVTPDQLGELEP